MTGAEAGTEQGAMLFLALVKKRSTPPAPRSALTASARAASTWERGHAALSHMAGLCSVRMDALEGERGSGVMLLPAHRCCSGSAWQ